MHSCAHSQSLDSNKSLQVGAEQTNIYFPLLKAKRIGFVGNHSSVIGQTHLVDSMLSAGIKIVKVFSPEHGFRGQADAGEHVSDNTDKKTGLPIISLYGDNKKPQTSQLIGIDILVFDIQDVGARFYTYISTLHYVMEAAAENNIPLILLDRPNPNGYYVDGPVLELKHQSFVGMHPVPIVHGMTIGEYAQMINGEKWLHNGIQCELKVISCTNYTHNDKYSLAIAPSPNLPNDIAINWYPSLCLFEGTAVSVGRGTDKPFQQIGHPKLTNEEHSFIPKSTFGAKNPKLKGQKCQGILFSAISVSGQLDLSYLIQFYRDFPEKEQFFNSFFTLLAGTNKLEDAIKQGMSEDEIRSMWANDLMQFKEVRKKYLLYAD